MSEDQQLIHARVSNCIGWNKHVYKQLSKGTNNNTLRRKWLKCLSKYYIDIVNIRSDDPQNSLSDAVYNDLVWQTSNKLELTIENTETIFSDSLLLNYKLVELDDILSIIPEIKKRELIKTAGYHEFISFMLRYRVLCISEGLFLSIDRVFYGQITKSSKLPVLECYASPLNNNIKEYCSVFHSDSVYGALPPYDMFIDELDFPCRLCLNPPYTPRSIKTCIRKTISYMNRCKGEFILFMPVMYKFSAQDELFNYPHTRHGIIEGGNYVLHNFLSETDIIASMDLNVVVNAGGTGCESQLLLDNIIEQMKVRSREVIAANDKTINH